MWGVGVFAIMNVFIVLNNFLLFAKIGKIGQYAKFIFSEPLHDRLPHLYHTMNYIIYIASVDAKQGRKPVRNTKKEAEKRDVS